MAARVKTKQQALLHLRLTWFSMLAAVPLYLYALQFTPGISWFHFRHATQVFSALSVLDLISFFWLWQKRYLPSVENMRTYPDNIRAIERWVQSVTILLSLAESHAVFGVALCFGGRTLKQSSPLFVVSLVLILLVWPRKVWASQEGNIIPNQRTQ